MEHPREGGLMETPVEREIRIGKEREDNLRRSRGMLPTRGSGELVKVQVRSILSTTAPEPGLPRDLKRIWAGIQMQRDIQRETQREDALVEQGTVLGTYDRGQSQQHLQARKFRFEQAGSVPSVGKPVPSTPAGSKAAVGPRGPSFAEAYGTSPIVILEHQSLLPREVGSQSPELQAPPECLLLLEHEFQEMAERELESQIQRQPPYGIPESEESHKDNKKRLPVKKLAVIWPPPQDTRTTQEKSPDQDSTSQVQSQKSALYQRWEPSHQQQSKEE
ncbi:uncharacterized protein MISP3 [Ornithorhynchus anatinus]|uniref:MISP family member 3 n=1 Tax=Ornithorhynchus anatinus TaxID=9258 RepID=F6U6K3_ORNAN|nr:uncharacterized protein MISP3 [Ornithorhynchus anatinus]